MKPLFTPAPQRCVNAVFPLTEPASPAAKESRMRCFVSGHDFSRADKTFNLDPPRGL